MEASRRRRAVSGALERRGGELKRVLLGAGLAASLLTTTAFAPHTALAVECPNEATRSESNINPATHEPYDLQLPECRAYEMVSPLQKGGSNASGTLGLPVAPSGEAVEFTSQNAFAGAENYQIGALGASQNPYLSRRTSAGWTTEYALPSARTMAHPSFVHGMDGDATPSLAAIASCGLARDVTNLGAGVEAICARREIATTEWLSSPPFPSTTGNIYSGTASGETLSYEGASADLSRLFFQASGGPTAGATFLADDTSTSGGDGLYEVSPGVTSLSELNLVNVNSLGEEIGPAMGARIGGISASEGQPTSCTTLGSEPYVSSSYQAISETGQTVFFTACPSNAKGGVNTLYARLNGRETVPISSPAPTQCATCNQAAASAAYEGASPNGEKAFFITTQQLTPADTDNTMNLYEYDFGKPTGKNLIQLSRGGPGDPTPGVGAEVEGVVTTSSNGAIVYFVARGFLTSVPNALGQTAVEGADNLYAVNSESGDTQFVARLCSAPSESGLVADASCAASDEALWTEHAAAQATPDGEYLVFTTNARLIDTGPEADTNEASQVYRYDFVTGGLVRISVGEPTYPAGDNGNVPGLGAEIKTPQVGGVDGGNGALASINDYQRVIAADGSTIIFATPAALQADDVNTGASPSCSVSDKEGTGCDVYLWHECSNGQCGDGMAGEVELVTPGSDPTSTDTENGLASISESGEDAFFFTSTPLVGQDDDELRDLYDSRVDGGFPTPPSSEEACSGEECQGTPSKAPETLTAGGSSTASPSGNLVAAPFVVTAVDEEPKPAEAGGVKITGHSTNTLSVSTTSSGALTLSGAGLATEKKTAAKSGSYTIPLTLTNAEKKLLAKRGHLTLSVTVKFAPTSGKSSTAKAKITIQSQTKKSKSKKSKSKKK